MSGIHSTHREPVRSLFAFVQARTGSTRFPKKVITELPPKSGHTILDHIHFRMSKILPPSRIVYLIPEGDTELEEFLSRKGMRYFKGPLEDVRQRYILAAEKFGADAILRLTGDNPFYDTTHLDLLIQSFLEEEADLAYFKGLPLGMGGELFRTSALVASPPQGLEERYREHVSIHIKEEPDRFKIVPIASLLTPEESSRIGNLRLTIDTPEDFQTLSNILKDKLPDSLSDLGASKLLEWEKEQPSLFKGNQDVPQVRFPLPNPVKSYQKRIGLLVAPAKDYGSGHFSRCSILHSILPYRNWESFWLTEFPKDGEYDILLIDYRDVLIPIEYKKTKVLLLDHFGEDRKKYPYWDLLPHPQNNAEFNWDQILLPPNLRNSSLRSLDKEEASFDLFCYAGSLGESETEELDSFLLSIPDTKKLLRVGGHSPKDQAKSKLEYHPRLSRFAYLEFLRSSKRFLGYFGQSLFEAIYLKIPSASFSISPVHSDLSKLLEKYNIPFADPRNNSSDQKFLLSSRFPDGSGYRLLLDQIDSL
ncbi:spore coat biosynthesis protein F [Leptospira semungkisensis]|uniref:Spore coat biosynthesis protein F n=1 Tax=Leptospira semungkisensis TaxID=2484985 RepID=A0A4R9G7E4_9LEPT|nr:spore coat biosynthesis protein F [Leptospira semungkisensis]TGK06717.1 spore coat biosynthesis protein F [Leptospira semungkisensis]